MTPRGRFNLAMGLLVTAAVAVGFWRWQQQSQNAAAVSAQIAAHAAQSAAQREQQNQVGTAREERGLPTSQPASNAPLPPWGEPLGANFNALRQRADDGDARAACRVGVELALCNLAQMPPNAPPSATSSSAAPTTAGTVPAPGSVATAAYCEGIDQAFRGRSASYLRKAALGGNVDAMLRYAAGPFSTASQEASNSYQYLQDPVFSDWYREALPMLQRALHAGNPMAAQLLANAYADDHGPLDALVANDPVQAQAYVLLLSYLRGGTPPDAGALDARQRAQAEQQAQRIYRESFGSHRATGDIPRALILQTGSDAGTAHPCE